MTISATTQRHIIETTALLTKLLGDLGQIAHNLDIANPGPPTSCIGARPGTGTGTPDGLTPAQRAAIDGDPALTAARTITKLAANLYNNTVTLTNLTQQWAYTPHRPAFDATPETNTEWCTNCLTIDTCSPIYRRDLCSWCYDFEAVEHRLPSSTLLDKHHQGHRITAADVKADARTSRTRPSHH